MHPNVRAASWMILALVVAILLVLVMPKDPAAWFGLGLASGLVGIWANWHVTKWTGCRRCEPGRWP